MNNYPNDNSGALVLQDRIEKKSKMRDIATFIMMAGIIIGLIPVLNFLFAIFVLVWFIGYIVIYFSIKNDRLLLESVLKNADISNLKNSNHPLALELAYHDDLEISNLRNQKYAIGNKRDKATFIYLIIGFVIGFFLIITLFVSVSAMVATNSSKVNEAQLFHATGAMLGIIVIGFLAILINWIVWIVKYITSYNSITRINLIIKQRANNLHNNFNANDNSLNQN